MTEFNDEVKEILNNLKKIDNMSDEELEADAANMSDEEMYASVNWNEKDNSNLIVEESEAQENAEYEEELEEEKKSKNTGSMLYGAETNPEMAEKFRKVQETHESQKAQNQKIANAINDVAETMESKERKTPVTGRRDPAHARSSKFIKVDWKPNEISNKAETLSANKDFKDNFIKTADELLGAGRFLWTGSDQYKQLKESVKACKQLMEKQGKMDPAEYNKQLQEHMETIIGKAGNYLKYKSQYAGKDAELKKQSSTAQSRYTAANKMWNLLVDQKKELEVYNAFSERSAIEMERADRKLNKTEKTIQQAQKTVQKAEKTIKEKTVQTTKTTVEKPQTTAEQSKGRNVADKEKKLNVIAEKAPKTNVSSNTKSLKELFKDKEKFEKKETQATINNYLNSLNKREVKEKVKKMEQNKLAYTKNLREAVKSGNVVRAQASLARLIVENHNQSMLANQFLKANAKPGAKPQKINLLSEEEISERTLTLAKNPRLIEKCKDFCQNPEKIEKLLLNDDKSSRAQISKNLTNLEKEFNFTNLAPEHAPTRQVVNDAPDFSMGMH